MVNVAIIGLGIVGGGVYEAIEMNSAHLAKKAGAEIAVKYILDLRDFSGESFAKKCVKDFSIIENDPDLQVVVETIGGAGAAYEFTKRALLAGKHVVTSNKELVAVRGAELIRIAAEKGVNYMMEASVGGGTPIIRPLIDCLASNRIDEIYGIMNGTTNYILTRMICDGQSFEDALAGAQARGYAELDPTADIEGIDAGRKICILGSIACGARISPDFVSTEGISKVSLDDINIAGQSDMIVKLLARFVRLSDGRVCAYVAPHMIDGSHILGCVNDVFNGFFVRGNVVPEIALIGPGAGKLPTASAVVADVVDIARNLGCTKDQLWTETLAETADVRELKFRRYIRTDAPLSAVESAFGKADELSGGAFITGSMGGFEFEEKLTEFEKSAKVLSVIRLLEHGEAAQ